MKALDWPEQLLTQQRQAGDAPRRCDIQTLCREWPDAMAFQTSQERSRWLPRYLSIDDAHALAQLVQVEAVSAQALLPPPGRQGIGAGLGGQIRAERRQPAHHPKRRTVMQRRQGNQILEVAEFLLAKKGGSEEGLSAMHHPVADQPWSVVRRRRLQPVRKPALKGGGQQ